MQSRPPTQRPALFRPSEVHKPKPLNIIQALALFEEKSSTEYGLALWAALHEVEKIYERVQTQIEYRRFYIAPSPPNFSLLENLGRAIGKWIPGGPLRSALDRPRQSQILSSSGPLAELLKSHRRIYDQSRLAAIVRQLVDPEGSEDHLMIVTDLSITPPANWRYMIWETDPNTNTSVISVAPLDPEYWREKDPERIMRIKVRARNAALSITGELIGLGRCDNPTCFLTDDVDSVTVLDEMSAFGDEHRRPELTGYGFDEMASDPASVQNETLRPTTRRAR
jgi:predicted Zn-dependent protease